MTSTVIGLFDRLDEGEDAIRALVQYGVPLVDISVVANNVEKRITVDSLARITARAATQDMRGGSGPQPMDLQGLPVPGIGPIAGFGWLLTSLVGSGVGVNAGSLVQALMDIGVPEQEAGYFAEGVRRGGSLVAAQTENESVEPLIAILNQHGALNIRERAAQWHRNGWRQFAPDAQPLTKAELAHERREMSANEAEVQAVGAPEKTLALSAPAENVMTFPVTEETLSVGKQPVRSGGVRVNTRLQESIVEEQIDLSSEQVSVERRPADRLATDRENTAFQETFFEFRERREEPVIVKRARIIEEVVINRQVQEQTHTVRETVRRTDVQIEPLGNSRSAEARLQNTAAGVHQSRV